MDKETAILVTGGTGFVGSYILRSLVKSGYTRLSALHRENSDFALVEEVRHQINWLCCDLLDLPRLIETLVDQTVVIHAAALVSFQPGDRDKLNQINIEGTANMINISQSTGVERFVHISSVGVFPRRHPGETIDESVEWSANKLTTDYAMSKYQAELEVWRGAAEGLKVTILNPSLVIGSGFWTSGSASIFKQVYNGLRFYPQGRTGVVDVRDVGLAVVKSLNEDVTGKRIIVSAENMSYKEILNQIAANFGRRSPSWRLTGWLMELALLKYVLTTIIGIRAKVLTRASLKNAQHNWSFDNSKSLADLNMTYRSISECIKETCDQFEKANSLGLPPKYLPL